MQISEIQRKIAVLLLTESKTVEDLNKQLNVNYKELGEELNTMIKKKLIKKLPGYPTKYSLDKYIIEQVKKRKEIAENDSFRIKIRSIIEMQAINKDLVKINLEKLKKMIDEKINLNVYESKISDILEQDNLYFAFLEITLSVKDFSSLISFVTYFTPSTVEVLKPEKLNVSMYELQDGLNNLAQVTNKYVAEIQKRMTKEDIKKMQDKIYKVN